MKHIQIAWRKNKWIVVVLLGILIMLFGTMRYWNSYEDKRVSVVFISKRLDRNDFWVSVMEGVNMAKAEYQINLTVMGPEQETDYELQNTMIEEAIEMKPDAIVLVPSDYVQTIPYAREIEKAGIRLVLMDSVMEEELGSCIVATDNYAGGRKMGEYMKQFVEGTSEIGIVSHTKGTSTAIERESGVRAGLGEYEARITSVVYSDSSYDKAYEEAERMLKKHPKMNMVICLNEDSSVGTARAVKEMGLAGKIHLIGFDSSIEQIQLIEENVFDAIVVQKPLNMGYIAVRTAYQLVMGNSVSKKIDSGSELITSDVLYTKENEKLLFPFREDD